MIPPVRSGPVAAVFQRTTTTGCEDCPSPPSGGAEWVNVVGQLALAPAIALVVGLAGYWFLGSSLRRRGIGPRTPLVAGLAVVAGLTVAGAVDGRARVLLPVAVAYGSLLAVGARRDSWSPGAALAVAVGAWGLGWWVATPLVSPPVGPVPASLPSPAGLGAVVPLAFPLGVALGIQGRGRRRRWVGAVGAAMVAGVVAAMVTAVPFPGGPAYLVVPLSVLAVVGSLVAAGPLVALGVATRGTRSSGDPVDAPGV